MSERFPKAPALLPLNYDNGKERQAAAFIRCKDPENYDGREWLFHSRGTATEAIRALRGPVPGRIGGVGGMDPENVLVCLDQPGHGTLNRSDLCWGGLRMTVEEFRAWYDAALLAALTEG